MAHRNSSRACPDPELARELAGVSRHVKAVADIITRRRRGKPQALRGDGEASPNILYPYDTIFSPGTAMVIVAGTSTGTHTYEVVMYVNDGEVSRSDVLGISDDWPGIAAPSTDGLTETDVVRFVAQVKGDPDGEAHYKSEVTVGVFVY